MKKIQPTIPDVLESLSILFAFGAVCGVFVFGVASLFEVTSRFYFLVGLCLIAVSLWVAAAWFRKCRE